MMKLPIIAFFMGACITSVSAGAGARVVACVNFQTKPSKPFTVSFNPKNGANKCMDHQGDPIDITVTESGLTCGYIGYVEAKATSSWGDLCATDESIWNIAYQTKGLTSNKSGSVKSRWRKMWGSQTNEISFYDHAPGSMVCGSESMCYSEKFHWDTGSSGPAYFIFRPDNQESVAYGEPEDLDHFEEPEDSEELEQLYFVHQAETDL